MKERSTPLTVLAPAHHPVLRRVNMVRSMAAHGTFLTGAAMDLFMNNPGHRASELMLAGVGLWAVGIPIRQEVQQPGLVRVTRTARAIG